MLELVDQKTPEERRKEEEFRTRSARAGGFFFRHELRVEGCPACSRRKRPGRGSFWAAGPLDRWTGHSPLTTQTQWTLAGHPSTGPLATPGPRRKGRVVGRRGSYLRSWVDPPDGVWWAGGSCRKRVQSDPRQSPFFSRHVLSRYSGQAHGTDTRPGSLSLPVAIWKYLAL